MSNDHNKQSIAARIDEIAERTRRTLIRNSGFTPAPTSKTDKPGAPPRAPSRESSLPPSDWRVTTRWEPEGQCSAHEERPDGCGLTAKGDTTGQATALLLAAMHARDVPGSALGAKDWPEIARWYEARECDLGRGLPLGSHDNGRR